jgi:hypothetical protein
MDDHQTMFETGDGGVAAFVATMVLVAMVAVGAFYYLGVGHGPTEADVIRVDAPQHTVSMAPAGQ